MSFRAFFDQFRYHFEQKSVKIKGLRSLRLFEFYKFCFRRAKKGIKN